MSRIVPLFSGSDGNATLISSGGKSILIDAGVSYKRLREALMSQNIEASSLSGIFITHEHSDHICGLRVLLKNAPIPLFASAETLNALVDSGHIPEGANIQPLTEALDLGNMAVSRFATSHDCPGSSGYTVDIGGTRATVCTDLGFISEEVKSAILGSDTILLESNHDIKMLERGPYPPALKMRILSDKGHLSNISCSAFLPSLLESGTKRIILSHLSRQNNMPALALNTARSSLSAIGAKENEDYILIAAAPQENEVIAF